VTDKRAAIAIFAVALVLRGAGAISSG